MLLFKEGIGIFARDELESDAHLGSLAKGPKVLPERILGEVARERNITPYQKMSNYPLFENLAPEK